MKKKFKFVFSDGSQTVEADTHQEALDKVLDGDVSLLGWILRTYQFIDGKWVRIV